MLLELATYDTRRKVNSQHGSMKMGAYLFQVHCQAASISDNRDLANDTLKGLVFAGVKDGFHQDPNSRRHTVRVVTKKTP